MRTETSDWIIGALMTGLGLLGLVLAAGALDIEISIFGSSLAGFAVAFVFGQIKRHYDDIDALKGRTGAGVRDV